MFCALFAFWGFKDKMKLKFSKLFFLSICPIIAVKGNHIIFLKITLHRWDGRSRKQSYKFA
jgi:hypothetical protein